MYMLIVKSSLQVLYSHLVVRDGERERKKEEKSAFGRAIERVSALNYTQTPPCPEGSLSVHNTLQLLS